ncbi:MAG TPA: nuclear transport factor 2 family protein [Gammaproteobacteria bacterium]
MCKWLAILALSCISFPALAGTSSACPDDAAKIAALDTEFQAAVARNDAVAVARLLPGDYVLVTGKGTVFSKADLVAEAKGALTHYTRQDDSKQMVRFISGVAVITALLRAQGTGEDGKPFDYTLWFSDIYTCRSDGWRYTFAQSSIHLPQSP